MESIIWSIITTILGIIGGYYASVILQQKRPLWCINSNILMSKGVSAIDGLEIKYRNNIIENLTCVRFAFWNNGRGTIMNSDIAVPITIHVLDDCKIYHAEVICETNESNKFRIEVSENKQDINITFKYLDSKHGAVIQFYTDCENIRRLKVSGTIIGGIDISKETGIFGKHVRKLLLVLFAMFSISVTVWFFLYNLEAGFRFVPLAMTISIILSILFILLLCYELWLHTINHMPSSLKKLFSET